jgi:hypothetical protein
MALGITWSVLLVGCGSIASQNPLRTNLTVNAVDATSLAPKSPVTLHLKSPGGVDSFCVYPITSPNGPEEGCLAPSGSNQPGNNPVNATVVFGPLETGHYTLSDDSTATTCELDVDFFTVATTPPPPEPNPCSIGSDNRTVTITIP